MTLKIRRVQIEKLFGYKDIDMSLDDITVLVGDNGTGKSTILRIIYHLIIMNESQSLLLCNGAKIWFEDGMCITYVNYGEMLDDDIIAKIYRDHIKKYNTKYANMKDNDFLKALKKDLNEVRERKSVDRFRITRGEQRITITGYLNEVLKKISVDLISTVDLSANSRLHYTNMEGNDAYVLDTYIEHELEKLHSGKSKKKILSFKKIMSMYYEDSGKEIYRLEREEFVLASKNGIKLTYKNLSSGERQLLYIMLKVVNSQDKQALILMDEPEISLHLTWQKSLIDSIKILNPNAQLVIVTHSPGIVMNGYRDTFKDMKDIQTSIHHE